MAVVHLQDSEPVHLGAPAVVDRRHTDDSALSDGTAAPSEVAPLVATASSCCSTSATWSGAELGQLRLELDRVKKNAGHEVETLKTAYSILRQEGAELKEALSSEKARNSVLQAQHVQDEEIRFRDFEETRRQHLELLLKHMELKGLGLRVQESGVLELALGTVVAARFGELVAGRAGGGQESARSLWPPSAGSYAGERAQ